MKSKKKTKKVISRNLGLEIGSICGRYFLKLKHLHYGYWTKELEVDITNLHLAQDEYVKFIVSHIPEGVKTILDVGCGTGEVAETLLNMGYQVDCVSPCPYLKEQAGNLLGDRTQFFECFYEDMETSNRYDMIIFCESFQYIDVEKALLKTNEFLKDGGYLFICDIFNKDLKARKVMGGGHKLSKFYDHIAKFPFKLVENVDITEETAPNMDLFGDVLENVIQPVVDVGVRFFENRHPIALKFLKWKYRKKIEKAHKKYLEGGRTGEEFKKYKSYQLFVYKKDVQE
ncbi:MAG: class I SAM-dependent methyltransferase [Planctomycetota bacterium]|jgi:SAM-dependent methyltransferase